MGVKHPGKEEEKAGSFLRNQSAEEEMFEIASVHHRVVTLSSVAAKSRMIYSQ